MKAIITVIAILSVSQVHALEYGECKARPESKKYINGNFHQPYPKQVSFTCVYDCKGNSGIEEVSGVSEIQVKSMLDDGIKVVCQGVEVRYTGVYFDYVGTIPFYAFDAAAPGVKTWAFARVDRNNPIEFEKLEKLKSTLKQIASTYILVGSNPAFSYYKEAGELLEEIVAELPKNTTALDSALAKYVKETNFPSESKENLLKGVLISSSAFRVR